MTFCLIAFAKKSSDDTRILYERNNPATWTLSLYPISFTIFPSDSHANVPPFALAITSPPTPPPLPYSHPSHNLSLAPASFSISCHSFSVHSRIQLFCLHIVNFWWKDGACGMFRWFSHTHTHPHAHTHIQNIQIHYCTMMRFIHFGIKLDLPLVNTHQTHPQIVNKGPQYTIYPALVE